jgi:lysophospholipid acyltransferase (LPLAT)-like uncharacterized protein
MAAASLLGASLVRLLRATVRLRHQGDGEMRRLEREGGPFIVAFWHRHLLLMPYCYRRGKIAILISRHRDGELIARTMERFGFTATRGSSTRGGAAALRELLRRVAAGWDLGFTPDGPRGPAGVVKPGVVQAAAIAGVPIQPVALGASRCRRLASWDRFVVPLPGSTVYLVYGEPLRVPRRGDLAAAAAELGRRLDAAEAEAEARARGRWAPRSEVPEVADA